KRLAWAVRPAMTGTGFPLPIGGRSERLAREEKALYIGVAVLLAYTALTLIATMSRSQVQASAEAAFPQGAAPVSRRRFLKTAFCSSAALGLALRPRMLSAGEAAVLGAIELLALGDFGSEAPAQMAVASAMRRHVETQQIR